MGGVEHNTLWTWLRDKNKSRRERSSALHSRSNDSSSIPPLPYVLRLANTDQRVYGSKIVDWDVSTNDCRNYSSDVETREYVALGQLIGHFDPSEKTYVRVVLRYQHISATGAQ
jgi:hypothetical protein